MARFRVFGIPVAQGSMRAFVPKGWTRAIITHQRSKQLRSWREAVSSAAAKSASAPLVGPVTVRALFLMPIPKSRPAVLKTAKQVRDWKQPDKRPDLDKLARALLDALTGVLFSDDSQVVRLYLAKEYGRRPGVDAEVTVA